MARDALERLVADAQGLPEPVEASVAQPLAPRGPDRRTLRSSKLDLLSPLALRTRVRELLSELGRRIDAALPAALSQADGAWDQVDALRLIDRAVDDEVRALHRAAQQLQAEEDAGTRAIGLEAQLTIDAALGLCSLLERRLATLVRLRLRAAEAGAASLLPDGKPFLDLGAALHETARRWV